MSRIQRREFLNLGALAAGGALLTSRLAFAYADTRPARLVVVILRGALDGLAAVPPYGDRDYATLRREFALRAPGAPGGALPLNGFFGLHPSLAFLERCYTARELTVLHALASPYRERSHFDGQNVLESGAARPFARTEGWLNKALGALPSGATSTLKNGPKTAIRSSPLARTCRRPLLRFTPRVWTTNSVSGVAATRLAPNCSAAVESSPTRTTSPGKSVAPAVIGAPFTTTCAPRMLVADATGVVGGGAPNARGARGAVSRRIVDRWGARRKKTRRRGK